MATIRTRHRKDGSLAYLAEIRIKRPGKIVHREWHRGPWGYQTQEHFAVGEVSEVKQTARTKTSHIRYLKKYPTVGMAVLRPLGELPRRPPIRRPFGYNARQFRVLERLARLFRLRKGGYCSESNGIASA